MYTDAGYSLTQTFSEILVLREPSPISLSIMHVVRTNVNFQLCNKYCIYRRKKVVFEDDVLRKYFF